MKVLLTGSHGLVGSELFTLLKSQGHEVVRLVRHRPAAAELNWDPEAGQIDKNSLEGFDAVIHLAGENIASGRWTAERKARIRDSRLKGTALLSKTLASLEKKPEVFICASAIGFYGDRADELVTEESTPGKGFLAELCRDWEAASQAAADSGIRLVTLRIGVVLSTRGGALNKMLPPFRMGAGGPLGSGRQYMSWIALEDLVGIIAYCLVSKDLSGPVNAVSPNPVRNKEFTAALASALRRPAFFPVPAPAISLLLGEMANELLLSGARVEPRKLLTSAYNFRYPDLNEYLKQLLGAA